jgi:hypothetical protein
MFHGVLRPAPWPKSVGDRAEVRLQDRLEYQLGCHLNDPVTQRGNAQLADLPRAAFGDRALAHRKRDVAAVTQRAVKLAQHPLHADLFDTLARLTVDTGGP